MFHNLENGPVGNVYIPATKQGDWVGMCKMPKGADAQNHEFLSFIEKTVGQLHFAQRIFSYEDLGPGCSRLVVDPAHEWAFGFGASHQLLGDSNHITYAKIYKTQAWVMIDEDSQGRPVWEKWSIRNLKPYWP